MRAFVCFIDPDSGQLKEYKPFSGPKAEAEALEFCKRLNESLCCSIYFVVSDVVKSEDSPIRPGDKFSINGSPGLVREISSHHGNGDGFATFTIEGILIP
jgi:hypothetical protein